MSGNAEAVRRGWRAMNPEARAARVAKLATNRHVFSSQEASANSKAGWGLPGFREKQRADRLGISPSATTREKLSALRRGSKRPATFGPKISAHAKKRWAAYSDEDKRRILAPAWRAARGARPSSLERIVRAFLDHQAIVYEVDQVIGRYHPDILIGRLVIECDGWFHRNERAQAFDAARDTFLQGEGYRVLRLPEVIIKSGEYEGILQEALA